MLGNNDKLNRMRSLAHAGTLSHAYLLTGERGMGKKTLAQEMCLSLFCSSPDPSGRACRTCPECKKVLSGNHPDIISVTHAKPAAIGVDDIREQVNDTVDIKPYSRDRKVYIIDEAEKMTPQAQNALLKSLEEPPVYVSMLILCSDEKKLLDTILSRCERIRLDRIPEDMIREFLTEENGIDRDTSDICAAFSEGNPGRALTLATSDEFKNTYKKVLQLLKNLNTMDASQFLELSNEFVADGNDLQEVLDLISLWFRDVAVMKVLGDNGSYTYRGEMAALRKSAMSLKEDAPGEILSEIEKTSKRLKANVNKELSLELLFIKIKESGR